MIEKLDIAHFGSFNRFRWDSNVLESNGSVGRFKKLNILYGRNYSGKTTLSRIFRSFEIGQIPSRYDQPSFEIRTANGQWTQAQLSVQGPPIRVYSKDFVEANLAFLRDESGDIKPFAVLGAKNREIEQEIEKIDSQLGSTETGLGLRAAFSKKKAEERDAEKAISDKTAAKSRKLTDKANKFPSGIKHNTHYRDPDYDIRKLERDIGRVQSEGIAPLDEALRAQKIGMLSEKPLPPIDPIPTFESAIGALNDRALAIAREKIQPSAPLQDLLNSAVLADWVKSGRHLHINRDSCAFCRQPLPNDLSETLNKHFNEESEKLQTEIQRFLQDCKSEHVRVRALVIPTREMFYYSLHTKYDEISEKFETAKKTYEQALEDLSRVARERSEEIFTPRDLVEIVTDFDPGIGNSLAEMRDLRLQNDTHTTQLDAAQKKLRDELRLSEVTQFVTDIRLDELNEEIEQAKQKHAALVAECKALETAGQKLRADLEALRAQLQDEKRGAERVNFYLNHSLGGVNLRLQADEEEGKATYRFRIMRGEQEAFNLSEGECSLVAFCYFLARLDDVQTQGKKPIIYIDDPISSLDNNHIFFIFSLIDAFIAKPLIGSDGQELKNAAGQSDYKYEQLFISTHNLEFLKYLKRLTKPGSKKKQHEQTESFLVTRQNSSSSIALMPTYLRSYITELNYLFAQIHTCADDANAAQSHHSFYNFGNNLRKFLEAFLFFKYPSNMENDARLQQFFGSDVSAAAFLNRLTNEHSHLEEFVDRGMVPIDNAEIARTAKFVLAAMKAKDPEQYKHFLRSIGAADPLSI